MYRVICLSYRYMIFIWRCQTKFMVKRQDQEPFIHGRQTRKQQIVLDLVIFFNANLNNKKQYRWNILWRSILYAVLSIYINIVSNIVSIRYIKFPNICAPLCKIRCPWEKAPPQAIITQQIFICVKTLCCFAFGAVCFRPLFIIYLSWIPLRLKTNTQ